MGQFSLPLIFSLLNTGIPFEKYRLDNGLEVILHEDHRLPIVAVNVMYHVGAFDEPRGRTGFAHLFEHLMYQGSRHVGDDEHMRLLTEAGAITFNAYTSFDHTEYIETVPANELELCLWLESDRMGYLLDTLDQARLDVQRDVVKNERRQNFDNTPYGMVSETLLQMLFPTGHPYHDGIIGSMEHLSKATLDDARAFFTTFYTPQNATLVLSGDFDRKQAKLMVTRYFSGLRGNAKPQKKAFALPMAPAHKRVVLDEPLGQATRVVMAWTIPQAFGPYHAEFDVLAELTAEGKSSRLYRELVTTQHVAQAVDADVQMLSGGSMFEIDAMAYPDVSAEQLEKAMGEAITKAFATPASEAELRRVKAKYETRQLLELETIGGDRGRANLLQMYNHYTGDPGYLDKDLAAHRAVDSDGIQKAIAQYLTPERRVTLLSVPKPRLVSQPPDGPFEVPMSNVAQGPDAAPWRAHKPASGPKPTPIIPPLQSATLANGLTILLGESHALPLVSVAVVTRAGSAYDPPKKEGLAHLTIDLMDEGAGGRNAVQLEESFAELGCDAESSTTRDGAQYESVCLKQNALQALQLLSDIIRTPAFEQRELDDMKVRRTSHYFELMADPTNLGIDRLVRALWGSDHPYGHTQSGTPDTLAGLTRDDVVAFHAKHFTPDRSAVIFAGDITLADARAYAEKAFGEWKKGAPVAVRKVAALPAPITIGIRVPNTGQTFVTLGARGVPAGHPDEHALDVVSDVFGGQFSSRLNMRLREELAVTYGAQSTHDQNKGGGVFVALSSIHAEAKVDALAEVTRVWDNLAKSPITETELVAAKQSYIRSLPGQFEHLEALAGAAAIVYLNDLPLDYFKRKLAATDAVTVKDAKRVIEKFLRAPSRVVVGEEDKTVKLWEDPPRQPTMP